MYELKTKGIVLGKYNLENEDETVIIFTEKNGKIFVRTKGTKKFSNKLKTTLEIFSLNEYYFLKKSNQTKYFRLIQAVPIKVYENIRNSLNDIFLCFLFVQLINKFTEPEDPNYELYKMTKSIFDLINEKAVSPKLIEVFFKVKLLKFTGFNINDNQEFLKKEKLSVNTKKIIIAIENADISDILQLKIENLQTVNNLLNNYIKNILNEDLSCLKII